MFRNDESIGYTREGLKTYEMGYPVPQTAPITLRLVERGPYLCLQMRIAGKPRGEETQDIWADVPIYNSLGQISGYEFRKG